MAKMHKGKFAIKKGQTMRDDEERLYLARGRREKQNKPSRGGGIKGAFRKSFDTSYMLDMEA